MLMMINNFCIKLYRNYENKKIEKIFKKTKHESKDFFFITPKRLEKFEQNNLSVALNVLSALQNSQEIMLVYKSEHNFKPENNVIL